MIRYLAVLGVFLFMGLWFLGEDRGQTITPRRTLPEVAAEPVARRPVFIPAARVIEEAPQPGMPAPAAEVKAVADPAQPPALPTGAEPLRVMHVPGGASVRGGPGKEFAVIGGLSAGDVVMVVDAVTSPYWVRIRVDGRGEGWVARSLLRE